MVRHAHGFSRTGWPSLPLTWAVFAVSFVVRCALLPITHGPDFVVWDLASRATLTGANIYANHPVGYPGGPYTYPPLFLYIELPFQWLALQTGLPFTVLGKLPIVAGDLLVAGLIAVFLTRRSHGDRLVASACGMYLLNPLVLYNGAFYGRFDALCVGLFLAALQLHTTDGARSWRFLSTYAAAIATKIYPVFLLPWLWMVERTARGRLIVAVILVVGGLSLPYLATSPGAFVADVLFYNLNRVPTNLSWQVVLSDYLSPQAVWTIGVVLLAAFAVALASLSAFDIYAAALLGILMFFLCSKVVIEQYFLWTFPFLIQNAIHARSRADLALLLLLSIAGLVSNHYIHPFGERAGMLNSAVALAILAYVVQALRRIPASSPNRFSEPIAAISR